jgi:phospholipase C
MPLTRRELLKGAVAAGGLTALGAGAASALGPRMLAGPGLRDLGSPGAAPIDTVVVVMMENRSFDHFLGWMPGAIHDRTRTYVNGDGQAFTPYHLGKDTRGCGHPDPGHGWSQGRTQLGPNRDASGFLAPGSGNDEFAVGYYNDDDIPIWKALSEQGTIVDQYFCSVLTSTWPNRWYQHGATSGGRQGNAIPTSPTGFPDTTIWDRCDAAGVSWAYYYSNLPFIGLYGHRFMVGRAANVRHVSAFYADAATGTLPQVCFVDPFFTTPAEGIGNDDHPLADIRLGQQFLSDVVGAFTRSSQFGRGALFVNYDEWGGFFDTVIPPPAADERAAQGFDQRGFRTPAVVISPRARKGAVSSQLVDGAVYDATSILKFIEWRFDLPPLTMRDADARNIGELLDFTKSPELVDIPEYKAPADAYIACAVEDQLPAETSEWESLLELGYFDALGLRTDYKLRDSFA